MQGKVSSQSNFLEESKENAELESQLLKEAVYPLQQEIESLKADLELANMKSSFVDNQEIDQVKYTMEQWLCIAEFVVEQSLVR